MDSAVLGDRVVVSGQLSVVSCQLSVVSCQLSVFSFRGSGVGGRVRVRGSGVSGRRGDGQWGLALGWRIRAVILDAELRIRSGRPFEAACFGVFIVG